MDMKEETSGISPDKREGRAAHEAPTSLAMGVMGDLIVASAHGCPAAIGGF